MFIAMHNDYGNHSTLTRSFSTADDAIAYASKHGADMAVHAPAGNVIWRSEYVY